MQVSVLKFKFIYLGLKFQTLNNNELGYDVAHRECQYKLPVSPCVCVCVADISKASHANVLAGPVTPKATGQYVIASKPVFHYNE